MKESGNESLPEKDLIALESENRKLIECNWLRNY